MLQLQLSLPTSTLRIDRIFQNLTIAVATTNAGNKVSTVGIVDSLSDNNYAVFSFKGTYEDQELSMYKALRVKLHDPYTI